MYLDIIPFILLGISNIFLVQKSYKSFSRKTNQLSSNAKSSAFARSIIFNNLLFFISTLPTAFASFFFKQLIESNTGRLTISISNCISFSYHALNFFTNWFTNIKFREEMLRTFCFIKPDRVLNLRRASSLRNNEYI